MAFIPPDVRKADADPILPVAPPGSSSPDLWRDRRGIRGPTERLRLRPGIRESLPRLSRPLRREPERTTSRKRGLRSVTVLLPALNEEGAVGSVIDGVPTRDLGTSGYDVRVWVVDGRSTDGTLEIARGRGADVFVQSGAGKGNGVRQALDYLMERAHPWAGEHLFVMLDADGTYPPEQIGRLLAALESGADVVLGSRFRGHIERGAITGLNRLGNQLLSLLATILYRVPVSDVCTGMWGFRASFLRGIGLGAHGFDLEADLYSAACLAGARLVEVPVDYRRRIGEAKLIPFRAGLLIARRLLARRIRPMKAPAVRRGLPREDPSEGSA